MSTPATPGPTAPEEKKKGLSKYVARMKSVLKNTKRQSLSSVQSPEATPAAAASTSAPIDTKTEASTEVTPKDTSAPAPTVVETGASKSTNPDLERARKLAQKYDLKIDIEDWKRGPAQQRVEKPIRMRVHRSCHLCNTTYGSNKICVGCKHKRCEQCPRYPKKKAPGEKSKGKGKEKEKFTAAAAVGGVAVGESAAETVEGVYKKYVLTIPSKTGGQDLVRKKPMQRVRRTCHECKTLFITPNKTCTGCGHVRCGDCPRDPAKKHKYPYGYPGDADPADTSRIPRFSCHTCHTTFKPSESTCSSCGHEKCAECPRIPARKINPEPDPEVLKRVQERLASLGIGIGGAAPGAGTDPPPPT